jgi:serine/threonine protein kinase
MLALSPLFPGDNEIDQLYKIHEILGTPSREMLQRFKHLNVQPEFPKRTQIEFTQLLNNKISSYGADVLKRLLTYHPDNRPTAEKALEHTYFKNLVKYSGNRMEYLGCDSRTSRDSSASRRSFNGSNASSFHSSQNERSSPERHETTVIRRLSNLQCKMNKELERNWNRPDVKKEIVKNQNSINENQRKTVSHPNMCKKKK